MTTWSYGVVLAMAGVVAIVLIVDLVRDRSAQDSHYIGMGVLALAMLVQLVAGVVALARTDRDIEGAVFVSYLVTNLLVPVVGAGLSLMERSRVGTTILLFALVTLAGLEVRLWDVWQGPRG
ncbi:hypothetical protein [Nocardioides sp.]|uniref:hypothetical protein n=1 Tax=Nocardioides sp. TaxID=35761 RepID=UPI003512F586